MAFTNFPQGVASFGVPIFGSGNMIVGGNVVYVDSTSGTKGNYAGEFDSPFATIAQALASNAVRANKDDVIIVKPGHTEAITAAGGITISKAGVRIIGMGTVGTRPVITFTTSVNATFLISANGCVVHNIQFSLVGIDALVTGISITGAGTEISHCEFTMANATNQAVGAITLGSVNLTNIHDCTFFAPNAGANAAIVSALAPTRTIIQRCTFYGDFAIAAINGTGTLWANVLITHCIYYGTNASEPIIELLTGSTGMIAYNLSGAATFAAGGSIVADAAFKFENYITDTAANSGILDPTGVTL